MFTLRVARNIFAGGSVPFAKRADSAFQIKREAILLRTYANGSLYLRENNIIHSRFPDIVHSRNAYIHEYVWDGLDKWPDKLAVVCAATGKSYTYKQLRKFSGKCAASFRKLGLQPGEKIALIIPNVPEFAIVILGANEAALPAALINPTFSASEIRTQLQTGDASAIVTVLSKYEEVKKSINDNRMIKLPIIVIKDGNGPIPSDCINFNDLIENDIPEISLTEKMPGTDEDTILIPFSSGTTGLPKGVELSHRNIVINQLQCGMKDIWVAEDTNGDHQEVIPLILPLFHVYGLALGLYQGLRAGAKMICLPKFSIKGFADILKTYNPSMLLVVPPMIQMMIHQSEIKPEDIRNLKIIFSGAAPIGEELIGIFRDRFKSPVTITQGYGMTEASPAVSLSKDGPSESVGYIVSNTQVRIVGQEEHNKGQNLGIGEIGEFYVKGPQIMKGYYKNPEATANTLDGEWLKTGDLGFYAEDGCLYVKDRMKDLIKVKGFQVAPAELEDLIQSFDKVQDVGVIGVADKKYGEVPKAFIVPKPGVSLREEEVKEYVAKRVVKHKHLGDVTFVTSIPKSQSGKILKQELRKLTS